MLDDFCKSCGAPISANDVYCGCCGANLTGGANAESNPFATPKYDGYFDANNYSGYAAADAPEVPTGPISAFRICMRKYVDFSGRASRSEYWYWQLANVLIGLALVVVLVAISLALGFDGDEASSLGNWVGQIVSLALFLPNLAVAARRLHDRGITGWVLVCLFVPFANVIAGITFFVLYLLPSQPGENKFGPAPRRRNR